ncbi:MAG: Thiolase, N-terminal domain, partial [Pseudomonadota bacterium]
MSDTLIAGLARTPIGRFQGALAGVAATRLGATALAACLGRTALPATRVKEVVLGNVLGAG